MSTHCNRKNGLGLARYSVLASTAFAGMASGAEIINCGGSGPTDIQVPNDGAVDLDINCDTIDEITLLDTLAGDPAMETALVAPAMGSGRLVAVDGGKIEKLAADQSVSDALTAGNASSNAFYINNGTTDPNDWVDEPPGFVAVQFDIGGNNHFGWIEVHFDNGTNGYQIHRYGYEDQADTDINTPMMTVPVELQEFAVD